MYLFIKGLFFKRTKIKTFFISRLQPKDIEEKVFLKKGNSTIDVTKNHGMVCLDPFCMMVWLNNSQADETDVDKVKIQFKKNAKLNATIDVSIIEKIATSQGKLLLYKIEKVKNHQLSYLHRLVLFTYLLRSKANTYQSRRVISALYSYPRNIIIVSYKDDEYYNIFPMDIHSYIEEEGIYTLGLRTTNITLNKILKAKKVVICDTDTIDINTIYKLGKHSSNSPTQIADIPFNIVESEIFGFPIPAITGSYKEIEVIQHKKMGYHMLIIGKVVNYKKIKPNPCSLYHIGFLQYQKSNYENIEAVY